MRINNNMSAVITNKQLLRTENNLTKSMERLSSGLKINHAKDNPAGMAISNKMQAQIDALDRASSNASDGTSVLQIADGALNETSAILQRMRELSVQAANGTSLVQVQTGRQGERIYKAEGLSCTLTSGAGGVGGKTGLYEVGVPIKENTKQGYKMAYTGDSIDLGYAGMNTRRGRVGHQIAHTLTTGIQQGTLHFVDLSPPPLVTEHCRCLNTRQSGIHNHKGECSGVLKEEGARAVLTPGREEIRQNGRRMKEPEEPMFTITATDRHGVAYRGRIRKLVPRECLRLQGFYDWQIDRIEQDTSDSQLYKQAGNGVTVNVIEAIGTLLRQVDEEIRAEDEKTKR